MVSSGFHPFQPLKCSYTGFALLSLAMDAGKCLTSSPSISYATHTGRSGVSLRTSILVMPRDVNPHILDACSHTTRSSHPHLLPLPVVTPNSPPLCCRASSSSPESSVTKGPSPTRVV